VTTRENVWIAGDYFLLCEVCGFKKRRSECRIRWDGAVVCAEDYEPRHPLDTPPPSRPEEQRVADARYAAPVYVDQFGGSDVLITEDGDELVTEVPTLTDWLAP
jgi:hypothetical protein